MMWSLIIVACVSTADGVDCHEVKWHGFPDQSKCLYARNEERAKLADAGLIRLVAKCEEGVFG